MVSPTPGARVATAMAVWLYQVDGSWAKPMKPKRNEYVAIDWVPVD